MLVECRDRSARWIRAELPELPADPRGRNEAQYNAIVTQRNALLEAALHEALAWDFAMLYRRDDEQRAMLTRAHKAQLEGKLSWGTVTTPMHAELVPAFVLRQARGIAGRAHLRMLADVAIERWVHGSPVGMTWDKSFGCAGGPCGTGYVSPLSRRFLTFYAGLR